MNEHFNLYSFLEKLALSGGFMEKKPINQWGFAADREFIGEKYTYALYEGGIISSIRCAGLFVIMNTVTEEMSFFLGNMAKLRELRNSFV